MHFSNLNFCEFCRDFGKYNRKIVLYNLIRRMPNEPPYPVGVKKKQPRFTEEFPKRYPKAVNRVALPEDGGRIVVVGDTHGQLKDLLWIFTTEGSPEVFIPPITCILTSRTDHVIRTLNVATCY